MVSEGHRVSWMGSWDRKRILEKGLGNLNNVWTWVSNNVAISVH
jgi:hypothetical protein